MKKLLLLLILSFFSAQGYAATCPDGSMPTRGISADGSYYEYTCASKTNTYKTSNSSVSTYPLAIQPDSLDVFCEKVNADCSDVELQKWYSSYFTLPWNKAIAIAYPKGRILGGISGAYFWYGDTTPNQAKIKALSQCNITKAVYSDQCYILIENHLIVNQDYIKLLNKKTSSQSSSSSNSSSKKIPSNAVFSLNRYGFKCNYGFVREGKSMCVKIAKPKVIPENAYSTGSFSSGDGWDCMGGYVKKGNKCVSKSTNQETKVIPESTQNESSNYLEEIKQAKELLDSGVITEDEFKDIKKKIIDNI
jgi:hypothetical protein